jgi:hypothetical protein
MHKHIGDWVGKSGDGEKRGAIEVIDKCVVIDGSRHEHNFQVSMLQQKLFQF